MLLLLGLPAFALGADEAVEKASPPVSPAVTWSDGDGTVVFLARSGPGSFRLTVVSDSSYDVIYHTRMHSARDVSRKLEPNPSSTKQVKYYDIKHNFSRMTIWMAVVFKQDGKMDNDLTRTFYGDINKTVPNDRFLKVPDETTSSSETKGPEPKIDRERLDWVAKCLKDFQTIKPGMTRTQVEKKLRIDGGLQSVTSVRYIHPECPYFKIQVEFSCGTNPLDENRTVQADDDKVIKVSKPYIELPVLD